MIIEGVKAQINCPYIINCRLIGWGLFNLASLLHNFILMFFNDICNIAFTNALMLMALVKCYSNSTTSCIFTHDSFEMDYFVFNPLRFWLSKSFCWGLVVFFYGSGRYDELLTY